MGCNSRLHRDRVATVSDRSKRRELSSVMIYAAVCARGEAQLTKMLSAMDNCTQETVVRYDKLPITPVVTRFAFRFRRAAGLAASHVVAEP